MSDTDSKFLIHNICHFINLNRILVENDHTEHWYTCILITDLKLVESKWVIKPLWCLDILVLNIGKQWHYNVSQLIKRLYNIVHYQFPCILIKVN